MIKIEKVSKKFTKLIDKKKKSEFYADREISFTAKEGEIVGVLGPNGAGKTTLLRMIAGIMAPTSGTIEIDGLNYEDNDIEIKRKMTFLTGNTKLYKDLSPYELLKMCAEYYRVEKREIEERISLLSRKFAMDSFLYQRIGSLSTGQTQRVAIARCLIHEPKYYILDEPTSGLDIISSKVILDTIKEEKKKKKCILYSTHYMEEAASICDKVIFINKGQVIMIGTPEMIKEKTKTDNLRDAFFSLIEGDNNG